MHLILVNVCGLRLLVAPSGE